MFWDKFFRRKEVVYQSGCDPDEEEIDDTQEIYEATEQLLADNEYVDFKIVYERIVVHTEKNIGL